MVARKLRVRSKPAAPRRSKTGIAAAPLTSFHWFADYIRTDAEKKEIATVIKSYIKDKFKGEERTLLLSAPEYHYTGEYGVAATIQWKKLGQEWPDNWNGTKKLSNYIDKVRKAALQKVMDAEDSDVPTVSKKAPMDIIKDKTSDFIANVEGVLDDFYRGIYLDIENYSVYNELIKADMSAISAKKVVEYYTPLLAELNELINKKTPDLVEGYRHMTTPQKKKYLSLIQSIVDDAERFILSKKAVRKTSKPKVKTADKQVAKLVYAKDSSEFKLTSINPVTIIGASRLYTFNVKTRTLTEFITERSNGFEVRGSTIYGIDLERSRAIRLRKPEEMLTTFMTKTPTAINKYWDTLTTKTIDNVNGRINKDTIILRALDK